jgi:hypothetical protein
MATLALAACDLDQNPGNEIAGAGSGGGDTTSASTGVGGGGGTTSVGTGSGGGGMGGSGGSGGGGACVPLSTAPCYTGPANTEDVGSCVGGTKTCNPDGTGYGECLGEVAPGFEDCSTAEDEDCNGATPACPEDVTWSKLVGDSSAQFATSVAVDAFGSVFVTGFFQGTADFGSGPITSAGGADVFVAKFDAVGAPIWSKRFGDANNQAGWGIAMDGSGNVVVAGSFFGMIDFGGGPLVSADAGDAFVVKLDDAGNLLWDQRFGGVGDQRPTSVAADAAGNVVVVGEFSGSIDFGGGPVASAGGDPGFDGFLAGLDAGGNTVWSKTFGDVDADGLPQLTDGVGDVAIDASGNTALVGRFHGMVDLGCGPLEVQGENHMLVAKLDTAGGCLWSKEFDAFSDSVAVDGYGHVLVAGSFPGDVDFGTGVLSSGINADLFVGKWSGAGTALWADNYDVTAPGSTSFTDIAADSSGNVVVTGRFEGELDFGGGPLEAAPNLWDVIFLAKLDPSGGHVWSKDSSIMVVQPDPAGSHVAEGIAIDSAGYIALGGWVYGTLDVGNGPLTSAGYDVLVARLAP